MSKPVVDILLATYNGEKYIEELLESICEQTYKEWHLLIQDDCSKDRTREFLINFRNKCISKGMDPKKIEILNNEHRYGSAKANFINMLSHCRSDYIMFCDQDDVWHTDKVEKTLKYIKKIEKKYSKGMPALVHTDLRVVDQHLNPLSESFFSYMNLWKNADINRLLIQNNITGCTVMINRSLCNYLKKVQDSSYILMHDHFAGLIAGVFGHIGFLDLPTIDYRQHDHNSVGAADARSLSYLLHRYRMGKDEFRRSLEASVNQIKYFLELYDEELEKLPDKKSCLEGFAHLFNMKKIKRCYFYMRNHVMKYGFLRKVMQIIWG